MGKKLPVSSHDVLQGSPVQAVLPRFSIDFDYRTTLAGLQILMLLERIDPCAEATPMNMSIGVTANTQILKRWTKVLRNSTLRALFRLQA